jgi:hypothetical protein
MDSSSGETAIRDVDCALYLKHEFIILGPAGKLQKLTQPPSKQQVYQQIQCISRESLPSRSTVYRWLKQLDDTQPALVAYGRGSQIAVRSSTQCESAQQVPAASVRGAQTVVHTSAHRPVEEASSTTFQKHREEQARFIAEVRAQHDRMAQTLTSLAGELVLDVLTGVCTLGQVDIEDRANGNESPETGMLIPRSTVLRPHGRGKVERTLDVDS